MRVKLDFAQASALGLHRLDYIGYGIVDDEGLSGAYLGNDDLLRARSGERGLVLFTEARLCVLAGEDGSLGVRSHQHTAASA